MVIFLVDTGIGVVLSGEDVFIGIAAVVLCVVMIAAVLVAAAVVFGVEVVLVFTVVVDERGEV